MAAEICRDKPSASLSDDPVLPYRPRSNWYFNWTTGSTLLVEAKDH